MKRNLILSIFILLFDFCYSQNTILYDFDIAKEIAKESNKLILIDFFTEWCGPCKGFDKELLSDTTFANQIFSNFILLKHNPEKENKHNLARKYFIKSYPTFVVLNGDGYLINKQYGGLRLNDLENSKKYFIEFLEETIKLKKEGKIVKGVSNRIDLEYPKFYSAKFEGKKADSNEITSFWESNMDSLTEISFAVFQSFESPISVQDYYFDRIEELIDLYGDADVYNLRIKHYEKSMYLALESKNENELDSILVTAKNELKTEHSAFHYKFFKISYLIELENWNRLYDVVQALYFNNNISYQEIQGILYSIKPKVQDEELMKKFTLLSQSVFK